MRKRRIDLKAPVIVRRGLRYRRKLREALKLAARWSVGDPVLAGLYSSAKVQGADSTLRTKTATIQYSAAPFSGGHYQMFAWEYVETSHPRQLASDIARSLHDSVRARHGCRHGWLV
jgi:hypothetical protein